MPRVLSEEEKLERICTDIFNYCCNAVKSKEYQDILHRANSQWRDIYVVEGQVIPAMGINYDALIRRIVEKMKNKFGVYSNFLNAKSTARIIEEMIPPLQIGIWPPSFEEWNEPYTDINTSSYLPDNTDNLISEWMKNDETIESFIKRINKEHHSFNLGNDEQQRLIYLDLFYTALEMRLAKLPFAHKIDEDYSNSIYVNPDFLHCELSKIFPFYKDLIEEKYDELNVSNVKEDINIQPEARYPLFNDEYDGKTSSDAFLQLSKDFEREIDSYKGSRYPSKILKACYPLYFFAYNNILVQLIKNPSAVTLRIKGSNFLHTPLDLSPLEDALQVNIKTYKYNIENLDNRKIIASNLYALNQFLRYIKQIHKKNESHLYFDAPYKENPTIEKRKKSFKIWPNLVCEYDFKKGHTRQSKTITVNITCDLTLTIWLFIRHSSLFRIALMPQLETLFNDNLDFRDEIPDKILWPHNFFTALNFTSASIRDYPQFYKDYNQFIERNAKIIYKKNKDLSVEDWLTISQRFERIVPSPKWGEEDCIQLIIKAFWKAIDFQKPLSEEGLYKYDELKFKKYYAMYSRVEDNINRKRH